jgi:CDP-diacylglycerol--serine O-phosphatidyltransferase
MRKIFLGVYNPSIILTYIGVFCALGGIGLLTTQQVGASTNVITIAMILLILSGVCDMFDGTIARMCKRTEQEKQFGIQLDSLADTVSFVVFPATVLLFATGARIDTMLIACLYVFAGIMRLGWFNVTTEENRGVFFGLPVTSSAFIFPMIQAVLLLVNAPQHTMNIVWKCAFTAVALLFIANFKLKKPKTWVLGCFAILAIATIIILLVA